MSVDDSRTPLTDQPEVMALSSVLARRAFMSVPLDRGTTTASHRRRRIFIDDARLLSGRAQLLGWDVIPQGQQDLSTWLCRGTGGDMFLLCRSGNRPDLLPAVVPLSAVRAATWFAAHTTHFGDGIQPEDHPDITTAVSVSPTGDEP